MKLNFEFLADRPEDVPQVISWWQTEWADRMGSDLDRIAIDFLATLSREDLPLDIIATAGGEFVGTASLKLHEMSDLYPDYFYWLGSVFVIPKYRARGVASQMSKHIIAMARERQFPQLYLQTTDTSGGLYTRLGWRALHRLDYKNTDTLLMVNESILS